MIPNKTQIIQLLEQSRAANPERNTGWVMHTICVGNAAGQIARVLKETGENYDVEKVIVLGYLHDIGKMVGSSADHPINGYNYLQGLGYDAEYCNISLVHHFINNDEKCVFSTIPDPVHDHKMIDFVRRHHFTPEEKLIALCDAMCLTSVMTLEKRIIDVLSRHGTNTHTQDRIIETFELKRDIDQKLGYNLYDLFPEIKENL